MAAMNKQQRTEYYRKILSETPNRQAAIEIILVDLNSLVWSETQKPLTKREKLDILDDIFPSEFIIRKSVPGVESMDSINEADNTGILDVISALKRGVKD